MSYFSKHSLYNRLDNLLSINSESKTRRIYNTLSEIERKALHELIITSQSEGVVEGFKHQQRKIKLYHLGVFKISPFIIAQEEVLSEDSTLTREQAWQIGKERVLANKEKYSDNEPDYELE